MRILIWVVRVAVFVGLFGFALRNTDPITVRFFFGLAWDGPLVVFLMAFLAVGAVLGLLAALPTVWRQRRELARLRKELAAPMPAAAPAAAAAADVIAHGN